MKHRLRDLIDLEQFQALQDRLNEIYSFPSAIIDNEGNVLTATAWQDFCTQFHRKNEECAKECVKSDQYILSHMDEANPAVSYRCPHGLIDNATPIIIDGIHYGNFFTGQFFLEKPDFDFFREQAKKYGFNEEAYLDAVRRVPIWTQEQLNSYLFFIKGLIEVISGIGLKNLKEDETRKRLEESEARYRMLHEMSPIAVVLNRLDNGRYLESNQAMWEMTGYTEEELRSMTYWDITPPDYAGMEAKRLESLRTIGRYGPLEKEYVRKDGQRIPVLLSGVHVKDPSGMDLIYSVIQDISAIRRTEEALQLSRQRLSLHVQQTPLAVIEWDLDGRVLEWNPAAVKVFGFSREEALGQHWTFVVPEAIWKHLDGVWANIVGQKDGTRSTNENRTRSGQTIFCEWFNTPLIDTNGRTIGVASLIMDITDRKKAEEDRQEAEDRYRRLIDAAFDGYIIHQDGLIKAVNASYAAMYGFAMEELIGMPVLDVSPPEIRDQIAEIIRGGQTSPYEAIGLRKDGTRFPIETSGQTCSFQGRPARIAAVRDITERKRAEEDRRKLEERLSRAEKIEAIGTMAGRVAHDLNNVLGVIVGYSELLLMELPTTNPIREHASLILQSSLKAADIIQDLLTMARRGVATSEVLNLNQVISSYFHSPEFERLKSYHPDVAFLPSLEKELLNIKGSALHLEKTVTNLVTNAAEAIAGHGAVTLITENLYLDKPITGYDEIREGDYVVLRVADDGEGISAENMGKIFEPFYTKKVMGQSGTGLGLSVVWGTVKDHHGYVDVTSEEGKGSVFSLYFPVTREEAASSQKKVLPDYIGRGETILVVDDIKEQRELAVAMLGNLGYEVSMVSSGEEAIHYLKTHQVDILVLDMIMDPGLDGLETYQSILEIRPQQKTIIVSGYSETDRVKKAQALGAGAYVRKPYMREKMGLAIRRELDKP